MEDDLSLANLVAAERKFHSQNGEDGVIAALFAAIGTTNRRFVEFGVEGGVECNVANLLPQGWTGLMMDGAGVSNNPLAQVRRERITAENINALFAKYDVPSEFDLLSIDIDGNDYWVWKALEYRPRAVVIEYNAGVPPDLRRVIPYDPRFSWSGTDYFGASLRALAELGATKGYDLVYCERTGTNAFFARSALPPSYRAKAVEEIHRPPDYCGLGMRHRPESRRLMIDPEGPPLFNRAVTLHQGGDPEQAKELYRQFLRTEPNCADAILLLATAEQQTGRGEESLALYRQVESVAPSLHVAFGFGCVLWDQGKLAEALEWFHEAVRRGPTCSEALGHAGIILKDLGQLNEAAECFSRAVGVNPIDFGAFNNLGIVHRHLGRLEEAVNCFRESLRFNPHYAVAYGNLGIALSQMGSAEEAIECFREATRFDPDSAKAHGNLGLALKFAGRLDEAAVAFDNARRIDLESAEAYNNRGLALKEQGRHEAAAEHFREALRLNPALQSARDHLRDGV